MDLSALRAQLPNVCGWIDITLQQHRHLARSITSLGFARLPQYFEPATLSHASVVVLDDVPKPPLTSYGLAQLTEFEHMDADGITYKDVYFLRRRRAAVEALHFHELVHVVQWQLLGPERFVLSYALGLARAGYENHPLERIAYALEGRFCQGEIFSVEPLVQDDLRQSLPALWNQMSL